MLPLTPSVLVASKVLVAVGCVMTLLTLVALAGTCSTTKNFTALSAGTFWNTDFPPLCGRATRSPGCRMPSPLASMYTTRVAGATVFVTLESTMVSTRKESVPFPVLVRVYGKTTSAPGTACCCWPGAAGVPSGEMVTPPTCLTRVLTWLLFASSLVPVESR